jgi:hypothetical protein
MPRLVTQVIIIAEYPGKYNVGVLTDSHLNITCTVVVTFFSVDEFNLKGMWLKVTSSHFY